jgi:hypothetical protein
MGLGYTDTDDRKLHVRNCKMSGFENGRHASRELELEEHVLNTLHKKAHKIVFHQTLCLCEGREEKGELGEKVCNCRFLQVFR